MCRFLGWGSRGESKIANDVLFTTMTEQKKGKGLTKIVAAIDNLLVNPLSLKKSFQSFIKVL